MLNMQLQIASYKIDIYMYNMHFSLRDNVYNSVEKKPYYMIYLILVFLCFVNFTKLTSLAIFLGLL